MSTEENTGNDEERLDDRSPDDVETVATIMVEVRDTAGAAAPRDEVEEMIRTRLDRAGIDLPESEIADLATQLVEGTD
ncbi:hypothetical protein JD276_12410 [Leucobacter sp. CSA1]|uniref:Uncharacterized protein n=1 Tax=Leucobacter chromiisoli TaxID=2796471 RepID=A0A934UWE6_9MICO|nr:hypothetical protein [Leucobacter chromiisoli]MBK0419837.1 hypothetical protein [Leucobacter chromiisoli]